MVCTLGDLSGGAAMSAIAFMLLLGVMGIYIFKGLAPSSPNSRLFNLIALCLSGAALFFMFVGIIILGANGCYDGMVSGASNFAFAYGMSCTLPIVALAALGISILLFVRDGRGQKDAAAPVAPAAPQSAAEPPVYSGTYA